MVSLISDIALPKSGVTFIPLIDNRPVDPDTKY